MSWSQLLGKKDGRRNNGGARIGAGRPIGPSRKEFYDILLQEVVVSEFRHGQIRRVKKTWLKAILDELAHQALYGPKEYRIRAAKAYLDITLGKPRVEGGTKDKRYTKKPTIKNAFTPKFYRLPRLSTK